VVLYASPITLQLSLNLFASKSNKSFFKGVLLFKLVLYLKFKEVVLYKKDTCF